MATSAHLVEQRNFSIGTVLSRAFGTLGSNPVATFGIAFLFGALPQLLFSYFVTADLRLADRASTIAVVTVSIASYVVYMLLSMLVQGALVRATSAYAAGGKASFGDCVGTGLSMAVPLIGLTILMVLGVMLGLTLLLVPGIMLAIMWSVAVPALVQERVGILDAFSRSRALTKGARWKIFGLFVLIMILSWILMGVIGVIMITAGTMPSVANGTLGFSPTYLAISAVSNTLILAFWGAVQTSLYVGLSGWKDGPQGASLEDIFA